jgi:hypothetical protein
VFPFRTASDSETTAPVLSLVSVVSIDRSELFITVFVMILNSTVKKATYTPGKLVTKARNKIPPEAKDNWVDYNLNRKKGMRVMEDFLFEVLRLIC